MLYTAERTQDTLLNALQTQYSDTLTNIEFSHSESSTEYFKGYNKHTQEETYVKLHLDDYDEDFASYIWYVDIQGHSVDWLAI